MTTQEFDIHSESFESVLPPRLTLGRDVADIVEAYKQPFIEAWGVEDKAVRIIEDLGYICFDSFGLGRVDGVYTFPASTLLGADAVALSDLVVDEDSFVVSMHLYREDEHLDLDSGKQGEHQDRLREHIVFIAPDMPPTAVFAHFIDGNHISDLSDAVLKYGSEILHPLSDEDCTELLRLLGTAKVDEDSFRICFEDRVRNHWEEY